MILPPSNLRAFDSELQCERPALVFTERTVPSPIVREIFLKAGQESTERRVSLIAMGPQEAETCFLRRGGQLRRVKCIKIFSINIRQRYVNQSDVNDPVSLRVNRNRETGVGRAVDNRH